MSNLTLDMATALDLTMNEENEAKFMALKNLYSKKLKSLMNSIDVKDREIAKYKILDKAGPQAKVIQELKKKVRTQETINDILKKELTKVSDKTEEQINEDIIRITLAGPERFRPLSREELENKIVELERKVNKKLVSSNNNSSNSNINNQSESRNDFKGGDAKDDAQPKRIVKENSVSKLDEIGRFVDLVETIDGLRRTVSAKNHIIDAQKDEIMKLKSRNAQLVVSEERLEDQGEQLSKWLQERARLLSDIEAKTKRIVELDHSLGQTRSEQVLENEIQRTEIASMHKQIDKYKQQVTTMLANIAALELSQEEKLSDIVRARDATSRIESAAYSKDSVIKSLEERLKRQDEKSKMLEKKVVSLERDLTQVDALRDQLRDKNIVIRDLNRVLGEKTAIIGKLTDKARMEASSTGTASSGNSEANNSQVIPDGKGASRSSIDGKPSEK